LEEIGEDALCKFLHLITRKLHFCSINVYVKRLGGSYGGKISRNAQIACACALVAHKLNRPARFVLTIESNMQSQGKRVSSRQEYEVGVDDNGVIQYLNSNHWGNVGSSFNEPQAFLTVEHMHKYVLIVILLFLFI